MGPIGDIQTARPPQLPTDRKIVLELSDAAREWLAAKGYDPAYGARPLKRVIQKSVQDPLAELLLAGKVKDGETVPVTVGPTSLMLGDVSVVKEKRPANVVLN